VSAFPFSFSPARGTRHSLSARGQFLNTFAGIGFSVAFSLFALAGYLIQTQFDDPIQAQSVSLLVAALSISTASLCCTAYCIPTGSWGIPWRTGSPRRTSKSRLSSYLDQPRDAKSGRTPSCPDAMWTERASIFSAKEESSSGNSRKVTLFEN
jgi:hypothetical protein